jgi:hypothetical protein
MVWQTILAAAPTAVGAGVSLYNYFKGGQMPPGVTGAQNAALIESSNAASRLRGMQGLPNTTFAKMGNEATQQAAQQSAAAVGTLQQGGIFSPFMVEQLANQALESAKNVRDKALNNLGVLDSEAVMNQLGLSVQAQGIVNAQANTNAMIEQRQWENAQKVAEKRDADFSAAMNGLIKSIPLIFKAARADMANNAGDAEYDALNDATIEAEGRSVAEAKAGVAASAGMKPRPEYGISGWAQSVGLQQDEADNDSLVYDRAVNSMSDDVSDYYQYYIAPLRKKNTLTPDEEIRLKEYEEQYQAMTKAEDNLWNLIDSLEVY